MSTGAPQAPVDTRDGGAPPPRPGRVSLPAGLKRLDRLVLPASFIVMVAIFAIAKPGVFLTSGNLLAILNQAVVLGVLAAGLTLVLASGDFDLSFNATIGLAGSGAVYSMSNWHFGIVAAIAVGILIGLLIGLLNGWLVAYLGGDAFIITLGIGTAVGGLEQAFTHGNTISTGISTAYNGMATSTPVLGIQLFVFISWAAVLILWIVSETTGWGRAIHAIGSNRAAALNAGINVKRKRLGAFAIMGVCAGIVGVILTSQAESSYPNSGTSLLIGPYTAAFLGAALTRRRFHPATTYLGVIYLGVLATGLLLTNQAAWVINVITGAVLVVAIVLSGQRLTRPKWIDRMRGGRDGDGATTAAGPPASDVAADAER
jgi:ribose transport system permease protein